VDQREDQVRADVHLIRLRREPGDSGDHLEFLSVGQEEVLARPREVEPQSISRAHLLDGLLEVLVRRVLKGVMADEIESELHIRVVGGRHRVASDQGEARSVNRAS
jgi:hypothetical protein